MENLIKGLRKPKTPGMNMKCSNAISIFMSVACAFTSNLAGGADAAGSATEKERSLIAVLQSSAPPAEKAITCKRLAVYGTDAAVPALAPLLRDPELASWARIPLEVIPGPAADEAVRKALNDTKGLLLIGVINSVGVRRDAKAIPQLETSLKSSDEQVASAAAVALGKIGDLESAKILKGFLTVSPAGVRGAAAEGCIRCADHLLADGKSGDAVKLYDAVRSANVPKQKVLEATRGAILARKSSGVDLLVEQLRSSDKALFQIGLTTARELPGPKATKAVETELKQATPERQPLLLLALAGRDDPAAFPTILDCAKNGTKQVRVTAVGILDALGKPASAPVLLSVAAEGDTDLTPAALAALARISGSEVDKEVLGRVQNAKGKERQVAIEVAGRRRVEAAIPTIAKCAEDPDNGIRTASIQALGDMGGEAQVADLVKLLQKTKDSKDRSQIEAALLSVSSRTGSGCSHSLQGLAKSADTSLRIVALHALASAGGAEALATVAGATSDKDETVQDEAVRTLANWPNTWPEDEAVTQPLLTVAKSGTKPSHQVLASRGYLQFLEGDKKLSTDVKLAKVKEILPLIKRTEEKQLAIAVVHGAPSGEGLVMLVAFAGEPSLADDACAAIVDVAAKDVKGVSKDERQKALQTVLDKSSNDTTKRKAETALKKIQ
jgi:HEAT repeat protein